MTEDPDVMEQRLDDLERRTEDVRRQAREHGTLPSPEHTRSFADPDGDGRYDDEDEDPGATMGF